MSPLNRPTPQPAVLRISNETRLSRRHFVASLATVSAAAILARNATLEVGDPKVGGFVEVNGWILKRSDLA